MSLRSTANNEIQRSRPVALSLTHHAGAGRHPSDPPHLDTGLRRYDGPRVTIPQVDIPTATLFEGGKKSTKFGEFIFRTLRVLRAFVVR